MSKIWFSTKETHYIVGLAKQSPEDMIWMCCRICFGFLFLIEDNSFALVMEEFCCLFYVGLKI